MALVGMEPRLGWSWYPVPYLRQTRVMSTCKNMQKWKPGGQRDSPDILVANRKPRLLFNTSSCSSVSCSELSHKGEPKVPLLLKWLELGFYNVLLGSWGRENVKLQACTTGGWDEAVPFQEPTAERWECSWSIPQVLVTDVSTRCRTSPFIFLSPVLDELHHVAHPQKSPSLPSLRDKK